MHGPYGLTRVVEKMPLKFIIKYLRKYGAQIGDNCIIDSGLILHRPNMVKPFGNLIIGDNIYLGHNLLVDLTEKVIFENDIAIASNCQIWTHVGDFKYSLRDINDYWERRQSVLFKKGFFGYSGVIYNPGAILGTYSRVYALSMVNGGIPAKEVWGGVPAKFIKERVLQE